MAGSEEKIRHLEMVQGIINRMASNSFYLKGWSVTLVLGILALKSEDTPYLLLFIPVIFFWILDSYYLYLERSYRDLYDKIRMSSDNEVDFDLTPLFKTEKEKSEAYLASFTSKSEILFYIPLFLICIFFSYYQLNLSPGIIFKIRSLF